MVRGIPKEFFAFVFPFAGMPVAEDGMGERLFASQFPDNKTVKN